MLRRGGRLADIQAQQVEVGRIRLGTSQTKTSRAGREYNEPVKLDRFRLTSRSEQLIQEAAALYGGEVEPWTPQSGGAQQWEVIINAVSIPVIVPPDPCSQFYEQWTGGKCTRRCDGNWELIGDIQCVCGPDPASKKQLGCKPTTRLSLMLAEMRGVGIWRLESHGYNAAAELPAIADLLSAAGGNIPARLEMDDRSAQIPDPKDPNKTITSRFKVPVLHVESTPAAIVGTFAVRPEAIEAPTVDVPALTAGPEPAPEPVAEPEDPTALQWKAHQWYEDKINSTTTRDEMMALRERIQKDPKLEQQFKDNLATIWGDRAKRLAANAASTSASPPASTAGTATSAVPPPPPLDRQAVWLEVNTIGGYRGLKLSDLKRLYGEYEGSGSPLEQATAEQLLGYRDWLKARPK